MPKKDKQADTELKTWFAVRKDLDMPRGKLATQAGHGYCGVLVTAMAEKPELAKAYLKDSTPRITVGAHNEDVLMKIASTAAEAGIIFYLVRDAGRTVFNEPTYTGCAFGPCTRSDLPPYLARLQLLKDEEGE